MTPSLVLLHGFTGSPASWREVRRLLEDDAAAARRGPSAHGRSFGPAVHAPAVVGHDGTAGPEVGSFEDEVDRLAATIWDRARSRDPGGRRFAHPVHLCGYSMGARLALGLLVRHPELFRAATLIGVNPGLQDEAARKERTERDEEWARLLEREGLDTFVAAWEALPMFTTQDRLPAHVRKRQRRVRASHDPAGLARSLRTVGLAAMPDYRPELGRLDVPIRLVVGEHDTRFREIARSVAEQLPDGRITIVPDAGHNVVLEHPAAIAGLLREDIA